MADDYIPFAGINLKILKLLSLWADDIMKQPMASHLVAAENISGKRMIHGQDEFYQLLIEDTLVRWGGALPTEMANCFKGEDYTAVDNLLRNTPTFGGNQRIGWRDVMKPYQFTKKTILKLLTLWIITSSTLGSNIKNTILKNCPLCSCLNSCDYSCINVKAALSGMDLWNDEYGMNDEMTTGVLKYIADDLNLITGKMAYRSIETWSWANGLWDTGTINPYLLNNFKTEYDSEVEKLFNQPQSVFMNWKANPFK